MPPMTLEQGDPYAWAEEVRYVIHAWISHVDPNGDEERTQPLAYTANCNAQRPTNAVPIPMPAPSAGGGAQNPSEESPEVKHARVLVKRFAAIYQEEQELLTRSKEKGAGKSKKDGKFGKGKGKSDKSDYGKDKDSKGKLSLIANLLVMLKFCIGL